VRESKCPGKLVCAWENEQYRFLPAARQLHCDTLTNKHTHTFRQRCQTVLAAPTPHAGCSFSRGGAQREWQPCLARQRLCLTRRPHGAAVAVQLGRELGFDLALTGASLKRGGGDLGQRIDSIRPPQEGANLAHQVAHALPYNTTFRSHSSHSPHTEAQQH